MPNPTQYGAYIPTTNVWDTESEHIKSMDITKPEFRELLVRLFQNLKDMSSSVNIRDAGLYDTSQFVNGQLYFPNPNPQSTASQSSNLRQVYRTVVNMGALLNNADNHKAHGITCDANTSFTRIYGVATNPTALIYLPLPYVGVLGGNIELYVDNTQVHVVTTADETAYTICYVVLEYLLY